jgi:hypothetical protein
LTRRRAGRRKTKKKKGRFTERKPESVDESKDANTGKRPRTRRLRNALIIVVSGIVILSACALWANWPSKSQVTQNGANANVPRAAILDGLYDTAPNVTWTETMVQYLSNAGYTVDVYRGINVTIDLLRNVGGYKILILRLHSATVPENKFLYVFSGEKYTESKYVEEQLARAVTRGFTFNESEPPYFALNSIFIGTNNPVGLNGTTLIMMGCNGTADQYTIQRFLQEGVEAYISWDGYVTSQHSDEVMLRLIKAMCLDGLSSKAAAEKVNKELGPDPYYESHLICASP